MADTNTNYLTKVEMDWEEIDRKVKLHRKKQIRRLAIIAACCVAGFAALYIGSQLKTYNKYKVNGYRCGTLYAAGWKAFKIQ